MITLAYDQIDIHDNVFEDNNTAGIIHTSYELFPEGAGRPTEHRIDRSEEHTSELQSLMRISYAVFCLQKKTPQDKRHEHQIILLAARETENHTHNKNIAGPHTTNQHPNQKV